jgi:hypothetical protein
VVGWLFGSGEGEVQSVCIFTSLRMCRLHERLRA